MKLTAETLAAQAFQARIALSEAQLAALLPKLNEMLGSFDALHALDTTGVEPLVSVLPLYNVMRADVVQQQFPREKLLANAPKRTEEAFAVPKTVE